MSRPLLQVREDLSVAVRAAVERALVTLDKFEVALVLVAAARVLVEGEPCAWDVDRAATSISDDRPAEPAP